MLFVVCWCLWWFICCLVVCCLFFVVFGVVLLELLFVVGVGDVPCVVVSLLFVVV